MACKPGDVLSVPAPAGVQASSALRTQSGAESAFNGAKAQLFYAIAGPSYEGLLVWSGLLTDELTFGGFSCCGFQAGVDARVAAGVGGLQEPADYPWQNLMQARSSLLLALPMLIAYEPANGRSKIGEAYALAAYAEVLIAESYCAGTPLDQLVSGGGIQYNLPISTDSLLAVAEGHFDSAGAEAHGDEAVAELASVGLGRVLLDRGQFAAAAAAVQGVPVGFVYNVELAPSYTGGAFQLNLYADGIQNSADVIFNTADQEGKNGLNFVSARDPRLVIDSTTYQTSDGSPWRVPTKFEANLSYVALATGIEAALIQAEATLKGGNPSGWATALRALRADSATHVMFPAADSLPVDSAESATSDTQVSLMFRERAFWLFGTGTRLGDLRRLIRQYGRNAESVFPTGAYVNGQNPHLPAPIPNYGTDVDLTLPTPDGLSSNGIAETNPNYKGCTTSTKTA